MSIRECSNTRSVVSRYVILGTFVLLPLALNAQSRPAGQALTPQQQLEQLTDRAIPPESLADAIVDFLPHAHMRLDIPTPAERHVPGRVLKIEKGPAPAAIFHSANTLIRPLEAGGMVKLFLKQYPGRLDFYIIAILPTSYTYRGQP